MSGTARNNSGFTLLEVLIAVVLLGILSAALYGSYFGVLRARDRASAGMESRRELGATLDLIRREVASAMFKPNVPNEPYPLKFEVLDRDYFGAPTSILTLTTLAQPTPSSTKSRSSGIIKVSYSVVEKDKKLSLTRQESDLFSEEKPVPVYPQMEQISSFLVECSSDGSKWVKVWNAAGQGLPKFVRITIQVMEEGKPVEFSVLSTPRASGL